MQVNRRTLDLLTKVSLASLQQPCSKTWVLSENETCLVDINQQNFIMHLFEVTVSLTAIYQSNNTSVQTGIAGPNGTRSVIWIKEHMLLCYFLDSRPPLDSDWLSIWYYLNGWSLGRFKNWHKSAAYWHIIPISEIGLHRRWLICVTFYLLQEVMRF